MCISGFQIDKDGRSDLDPSMITTKRMDFLRCTPGSIYEPAIGDDVPTQNMQSDEVKCFGDPAEEDALIWARRGGTSFAQGHNASVSDME